MGDNARDAALFEKHDLADVPRLADPDCRLYRQFGLDMGGFSELLGPIVWHLETVALQSADTMPAYEPCHESQQVAVAV